MRFPIFLVLLIAAATALPGCCRTCSSETAILIETLDVAGTIGSARHLAHWSQVDVDAAAGVSESEKSDMRARAQILNAHADKLADALERFDETGKTNQSITLNNLKIRARSLEAETQTVLREWTVWQVRSGLKKPEEVFEFVNVKELIAADTQ